MWKVLRGVVLAFVPVLVQPSMAVAETPVCAAASVGTVACFVRRLCACTFARGGGMTGLPSGYRWDCGQLRPGCGDDAVVPATIDPYRGPLPSALSLDRNQTIINTQTGAGSQNQTLTGDRPAGNTVIQPSQSAVR